MPYLKGNWGRKQDSKASVSPQQVKRLAAVGSFTIARGGSLYQSQV